ncbi:MAG: hypothetical protein ACXVY5_06080 [Gaiellales bacterium]
MRVPIRPLPGVDLEGARPNWLTAGALRLGLLCAFIVAVGMLRPRISPHTAGVIVLVGVIAVAAGAAGFVAATRRLASRLPLLSGSQRVADAAVLVLRRTGLPLLGLAFFLFWTFVYLALWWYHPGETFTGLERNPRFADFFYYAVSTAFISPPGDILAHSRGARSATMIEMMTGFALLTAYLSSFIDWQRGRAPD